MTNVTTAEKLVKIAENEQKVYEAGQKSEYDRFWDAFQNYGKSMNGRTMFSSYQWMDSIYNPKHDMIVSDCTQMYRFSKITDTKVAIDVSNATGSLMFDSCQSLVRIHKLMASESTVFTLWFQYCSALEEIRFEGVIGTNDLNVQWSKKLTHDSLMSIINALADKSGDTSGTTWTVTIGADNYAKLSAEEIAIADEKGWTLT